MTSPTPDAAPAADASTSSLKFLVYWNHRDQADLLRLYLAVDGDRIDVQTDLDEFVDMAGRLATTARGEQPDAVLMAINHPDYDRTFAAFESVRTSLPEVPVLVGLPPCDVYRVARFLTAGARAYVIRDDAGDFLFLVRSLLDGVVDAVCAERAAATLRRLEEEVESVRRLQGSLIPRELTPPPGYAVAAGYESGGVGRVVDAKPGALPMPRAVLAGGDYYDAFLLADGRMVLLVGDASGHGLKACLSILVLRTLVRTIHHGEHDSRQFVTQINQRLCEEAEVGGRGGFVTLLFAILDPRTHQLEWTSAGHPLPLLHHLGSGEVDPIAEADAVGLPLGVRGDAAYTRERTTLPAASRLLVYTDGLVTTREDESSGGSESSGDEFAPTAALRESSQSDLPAALSGLLQASTRWGGRAEDASAMLLQRLAD